jgi:hypothetical protein
MCCKFAGYALLLVFLFSCRDLDAQSPGGVAHQSFWLQGDTFSNANKTKTGALNFNPATRLANLSPINLAGGSRYLRRSTIFTVYQESGAIQDSVVWKISGDSGDLLLSTRQVSSISNKMNMIFAKSGADSSVSKSAPVLSTYLGGQKQKQVSANPNGKEFAIQFGTPGLLVPAEQTASVAEFIVYETMLKEKDVAKIETYLALKYGITLEKNYQNSQGQTVWNRITEKLYSNNIAGIGRDDLSTLNQKQGISGSTTDQLTIGINSITRSNANNTGRLNNMDYLVWGDNAQPLTFARPGSSQVSDFLMSERKWAMISSGRTPGTISTELKIDTKTLQNGSVIPNGSFYLIIDRSGAGDFIPANCTYIMPDNISADGIATFSKVYWDTHGSGKEVFSFGLKTGLIVDISSLVSKLLSFHVYPNPVSHGNYNVAVTFDKPTDISIQVYDVHMQLIESKKATGQAQYLIPGYIKSAAGPYIIRLLTNDKEFSTIVVKQ